MSEEKKQEEKQEELSKEELDKVTGGFLPVDGVTEPIEPISYNPVDG